MPIISLVCDKGGVGKTTTAAGLAVNAAKDGLTVIVVDASPQASLYERWLDETQFDPAAWPFTVSSNATKLAGRAAKDLQLRADLVIVDTPPENDPIAVSAAEAADLVLIPCSPSLMDLRQLLHTEGDLLRGVSAPSWVVLNLVILRTIATAKAAERVTSRGMRLCPVQVRRRQALVEWPYGPPPLISDHQRLWAWVREQLGV